MSPSHATLLRSPRSALLHGLCAPTMKFSLLSLSVSPHPDSATRGWSDVWSLPCPQPLTVPGTQKTFKSMAPSVRPPPPSGPARSGACCRKQGPSPRGHGWLCQGQLCGPEAHKEAQCSHRGRLWPPHRASLFLPAAAAKPGPRRGHQAPARPSCWTPHPAGHTGGRTRVFSPALDSELVTLTRSASGAMLRQLCR